MNGGLDLTSIRCVAAARRRIVCATQLSHLSLGVLQGLTTGDEIGIAQAHFGARGEPEEFLRRVLHEIVLLDINLACKLDLSDSRCGVVRMIYSLKVLDLPFRIVLDHHLEGPQHRHAAQCLLIEDLTHRKIEHAHVDDAIGFGDTDTLDKIAYSLRRYAAAA